MKIYIFFSILIFIFSCKQNNTVIQESKKINSEAANKKSELDYKNIQEIGNFYKPVEIVVKENRIGNNFEKEEYKITLKRSDLLDNDSTNIKKHAENIALIYYRYLEKNVSSFSFKKIIVEIEHRHKKIDTFEYLERDIDLLN